MGWFCNFEDLVRRGVTAGTAGVLFLFTFSATGVQGGMVSYWSARTRLLALWVEPPGGICPLPDVVLTLKFLTCTVHMYRSIGLVAQHICKGSN